LNRVTQNITQNMTQNITENRPSEDWMQKN
jgi:hypothetical protein